MTCFDEVCSCSYETATHVCMCTRRKEQARDRCKGCFGGRHRMMLRAELDELLPANMEGIER